MMKDGTLNLGGIMDPGLDGETAGGTMSEVIDVREQDQKFERLPMAIF